MSSTELNKNRLANDSTYEVFTSYALARAIGVAFIIKDLQATRKFYEKVTDL